MDTNLNINRLANCKHQVSRYLYIYQYASVAELQKDLKFSRQLIHRKLKELIGEGLVYKSGKPPAVLYFPKKG